MTSLDGKTIIVTGSQPSLTDRMINLEPYFNGSGAEFVPVETVDLNPETSGDLVLAPDSILGGSQQGLENVVVTIREKLGRAVPVVVYVMNQSTPKIVSSGGGVGVNTWTGIRETVSDLLSFTRAEIFREIHPGMNKPRSGWLIRDIPRVVAETVWEHATNIVRAANAYGRAVPGLNRSRLTKIAAVHDFAEYEEKDYMPGEISLEEKFKREKAVMEKLRDKMGKRGEEMYQLWLEYEERKTPEAIAVKQLDIMDAGVCALDYNHLGYTKAQDFFQYTTDRLEDPLLVKIFSILLQRKYPNISYFIQYMILLEVIGDENLFDARMQAIHN